VVGKIEQTQPLWFIVRRIHSPVSEMTSFIVKLNELWWRLQHSLKIICLFDSNDNWILEILVSCYHRPHVWDKTPIVYQDDNW